MRKLFLVILTPIIVFTAEDLNSTEEKHLATEANLSVMMRQLSMVDNEERFLLMNAIKRKLVKLKMQQRKEAIHTLRTSMKSDSSDGNVTINERAIKEIRIMPQHLENRPNPPHRGNRPPHRPPPRK